ncbi:MAG: M28 family peptidase [Bryobacteraceae bacterium]|nr:M28 family peptidase [Bryobacterales bacterium]MEB2362340.1 M28 family peptidase [Bryobacterales bacterium]NUN04072.1 M28 family peptidase [Bryobacteraceae bacterium]
MHCQKALLMLWAPVALGSGFSGESALEFTQKAVEFGPRPPGSAAIQKLQQFILQTLRPFPCRVIEDGFMARTPRGRTGMKNIIALFPGTSGKALVVSGHYDTKWMPDIRFVGANDGGSSTGFLLEMARVLSTRKQKDDIYLVWFDGEEAIERWSEKDGIYGSRHLARKWAADGTLRRVKALINVDMIGDRNLTIQQEMLSVASLRQLVWRTAAGMGFGRYFTSDQIATEDDHVPFLRAGVNAIDIIDFDYGSGGESYWHTERDTMDKLSANSFEVVGKVVLEVLRRLQEVP